MLARDGKDPVMVAVPVMFGIDYNRGGQETLISNCVISRYDSGVGNRQKSGTAVCIPLISVDRLEKHCNGKRNKENGEDMFTLTSADHHGVALGVEVISEEVSEDDLENNHPGIYVKLAEDCIAYATYYEKYDCYIVIRKLTPKECFRLQGWSDDYFDKAEFVNSNSQLYKQAGNGVTVNVVEVVGRRLAELS